MWPAWRTNITMTALVPMDADTPVRIIGVDRAGPLLTELDHALLVDTVAERVRARLAVDDVEVVDGCLGRACVRWQDRQPCLTTKTREERIGTGTWSIALRMAGHHTETAESLVGLFQGADPTSIAMDIALFDPQQRLITTQRVTLQRDEAGGLTRNFGRALPNSIYATRQANGAVVGGRARPDLPNELDFRPENLIRQVVDDGAWLLSWMSRDVPIDLPVPVLGRGAGARNDEAIDLARAGDVDAAIDIWEELGTTDWKVTFNLGMAHGVQGNDSMSVVYLEQAQSKRSTRLAEVLLEGARAREAFRNAPREQVWCSEPP